MEKIAAILNIVNGTEQLNSFTGGQQRVVLM